MKTKHIISSVVIGLGFIMQSCGSNDSLVKELQKGGSYVLNLGRADSTCPAAVLEVVHGIGEISFEVALHQKGVGYFKSVSLGNFSSYFSNDVYDDAENYVLDSNQKFLITIKIWAMQGGGTIVFSMEKLSEGVYSGVVKIDGGVTKYSEAQTSCELTAALLKK